MNPTTTSEAQPMKENPVVEAAPDGGLRFTLGLPPLANRFYRRCGHRMVMSTVARAYKAEIALLAGMALIEGPICVYIDIYRARHAGDLDGYLKVTLDSLQGVAYQNDAQIVQIVANRFDDKENPRAIVVVAPSQLVTEIEQPKPPKKRKVTQAPQVAAKESRQTVAGKNSWIIFAKSCRNAEIVLTNSSGDELNE
jgi:Holliday junction resolvase RusA-like endonuclease